MFVLVEFPDNSDAFDRIIGFALVSYVFAVFPARSLVVKSVRLEANRVPRAAAGANASPGDTFAVQVS